MLKAVGRGQGEHDGFVEEKAPLEEVGSQPGRGDRVDASESRRVTICHTRRHGTFGPGAIRD